jgi:hypothetical protein
MVPEGTLTCLQVAADEKKLVCRRLNIEAMQNYERNLAA